jgi:hypothetical protein
MPDFDFIGYPQNKIDELIETITPVLKTLSFADDIVFIRRYQEDSKVIQLKGGEAPFVRIFTRSDERAQQLTEKLKHFFDIEIIFIAYFTPQVNNA